MTEEVATQDVSTRAPARQLSNKRFPSTAGRHHRRGPAKRFLLLTGPFLFLAAAVTLSAGVVQIIEQPPRTRPGPTLAEERAAAERLNEKLLAEAAASPALPMQTLPAALLGGSSGDLERAMAATLPAATDSEGGMNPFAFTLSPDGSLLNAEPAVPYPASSRYYGLR